MGVGCRQTEKHHTHTPILTPPSQWQAIHFYMTGLGLSVITDQGITDPPTPHPLCQHTTVCFSLTKEEFWGTVVLLKKPHLFFFFFFKHPSVERKNIERNSLRV